MAAQSFAELALLKKKQDSLFASLMGTAFEEEARKLMRPPRGPRKPREPKDSAVKKPTTPKKDKPAKPAKGGKKTPTESTA